MFGIRKKAAGASGPFDFMVAGLGNPGREYETTRHNAGFLALDRLAGRQNCEIKKLKYKALWGECMIGGKRVLLVKPQTFMNLSGESVREFMSFYRLPPERVLVMFDDISLEVGRIRIRRKGSDGGHNGMKNIICLTASDQFPRIKIGVGAKPHPDYDLAAWVLSSFKKEEAEPLDAALTAAAEAAELIVSGGDIDRAMNQFNR